MIYISHLIDDQDMQELIQETGCGVESIEFSISENLDSLYPKLRSYEKRLHRMGCEDLIVHGPFLDLNPMAYDRYVLEITRQRYEQAYLAAQFLGAKKIVFHTCYIPKVYMLIGWADRVVDFWNRFLEGKDGIQIVMENVEDPEILPILEVAEKVQHPDFGICLDIGHAHCYAREPVTEWAQQLRQYIKHIHLSDNDGTADSHLGIGSGTVPAQETLSCIHAYQPEVTHTIECADRQAILDTWKWMQQKC